MLCVFLEFGRGEGVSLEEFSGVVHLVKQLVKVILDGIEEELLGLKVLGLKDVAITVSDEVADLDGQSLFRDHVVVALRHDHLDGHLELVGKVDGSTTQGLGIHPVNTIQREKERASVPLFFSFFFFFFFLLLLNG
jgi:hypothetical protein